MLKLFFDDVRPEEWTPGYAGNSSRMDFLLKREEIVIEIKKTRNTLIAFVYDPDKHIDNPIGLETDLSESTGNWFVKVIITQG